MHKALESLYGAVREVREKGENEPRKGCLLSIQGRAVHPHPVLPLCPLPGPAIAAWPWGLPYRPHLASGAAASRVAEVETAGSLVHPVIEGREEGGVKFPCLLIQSCWFTYKAGKPGSSFLHMRPPSTAHHAPTPGREDVHQPRQLRRLRAGHRGLP